MTSVDNKAISVDIKSNGTDTTAITEAWFSRDQVSSSSGTFDRVYAIHCTTCLNYPKFPTLIEYNTFDSNCIRVDSDRPYANPVCCNRYIGESINIGDVALTKVLFPSALKQAGYVSMLLYSGNSSDPTWYSGQHSVSCMSSTNWVYQITLDSYMCKDLDTVVQFTSLANGALSPYCVMSCLHTSNYSNPHTDLISHMGSSDNNGYMSTISRYAALTSPFNGVIIGNTMIANDYSTRYLGDQVILEQPSCIASDSYYICMNRCGYIATSTIVYPGRYYSYLVLAGPLSASSLDTTASVAGIRRCTGSYIDGHWDEWTDSCVGINITSFFNAADGHLYTCVYLTDMSICAINLRFSAIENEQVYGEYAIKVCIYTPTYTTLTFEPTVKDPVALRAPVYVESSSDISGCANASWSVADCTDLTYYTELGGGIIEQPSIASLRYTADLSQTSGGFYTTCKEIDICECTDLIHALATKTLDPDSEAPSLSSIYADPDQLTCGLYESIIMCSCVGIECAEADPITGCIETSICYVTSCTPALGFTIAPTGILYCDVEDKCLEYAVGQDIRVDWITIPYLSPKPPRDTTKCRSYVWHTCRNASSYLCDTCVYGVVEGDPNYYALECEESSGRTQFFTVNQCQTVLTTTTDPDTNTQVPDVIGYCEYGTLTLGCAYDSDGAYVNRPYLIPDNVLGGLRYPDALYIVNRAQVEVSRDCVKAQRININTYYCCAYFSVPEGSSLQDNGDGTYYLEGNEICIGKDVIINATPYGANHCTATISTCGDASIPGTLCYENGKWTKRNTDYAQCYLACHPAQLYVSYPANGCDSDSQDYRVICSYLNVYVCYDIGELTLMSYDDPSDESQDIALGIDEEGRQYITYSSPAGTTQWNAANLVHWTPASASFSLCYAVDPEESLSNSISVDGSGMVCLTLGEDQRPVAYGLGAVTITAAQCSTGTVLSKKLYMCVQLESPSVEYSVTFPDLPEGITITDLSPADTSALTTGTEVSFRIQNTTEQQIGSVTANGDIITDSEGLYTIIVAESDIEVAVTLI